MLFTMLSTVLLVAVDQLTKYLATMYLAPVGVMPFIPGVMQLQYVLNDGAAFSMFSGNQIFLIVITGVALVMLSLYLLLKRPQNKVEYFAWILVLAGGIGNLIDRVLNGVVVDFFALTFMDFAVFNVADCFVCVGVFFVFVAVIHQEIKATKAKKETIHDKL